MAQSTPGGCGLPAFVRRYRCRQVRTVFSVAVDTTVPDTIADLAASVPPDKRRETTFRLAWTAPSDGAGTLSTYDVRVSTSPIDAANFDSAESVQYTGAPAQAGQPDGIDVINRYIERDYYFAVAAVDVGGNRATIATTGPARATFNQAVLAITGGTNEGYGRTVDGSHSLNGDAYADLIRGFDSWHGRRHLFRCRRRMAGDRACTLGVNRGRLRLRVRLHRGGGRRHRQRWPSGTGNLRSHRELGHGRGLRVQGED